MSYPLTPETRSVIFSVSAATLNAVDTADQTLYTFPTNTRFIRVPKLLQVSRAAGTAYTWTVGELSQEYFKQDAQDYNREDPFTLDVCWNQTKSNWNTAYTTDAVFKLPKTVLTDPTANEAVLFAFRDGLSFGVDGKTSLVLRAPRNVTVSGGTGALTCRLVYEDYMTGALA